MKLFSNHTPTESRRFAVFSNFRDSKRVRWIEFRHYVH